MWGIDGRSGLLGIEGISGTVGVPNWRVSDGLFSMFPRKDRLFRKLNEDVLTKYKLFLRTIKQVYH